MIATLLFRLLMIQMAIQFTMTAILEGRTSHYVSLLDPSGTDSSAQRITCPVYSIRIQNQTTKFTKYIVSEAQFDLVADSDWTDVSAASFKLCASAASSDNKKMFMWVDDECKVTDKIFKRLSEPCNEETSTLVYMIEPTVLPSSCETQFQILNDGETSNEAICSGSSSSTTIKCMNGKIFGYDEIKLEAFYSDGSGCMIFKSNSGDTDHTNQDTICGLPCSPSSDADRAEYVEILKEMAIIATDEFSYTTTAVNLDKLSGTWKWGTSNVAQPEDEGWRSGSPSSFGSFFHGYIKNDGLFSGPQSAVGTSVCCYEI